VRWREGGGVELLVAPKRRAEAEGLSGQKLIAWLAETPWRSAPPDHRARGELTLGLRADAQGEAGNGYSHERVVGCSGPRAPHRAVEHELASARMMFPPTCASLQNSSCTGRVGDAHFAHAPGRGRTIAPTWKTAGLTGGRAHRGLLLLGVLSIVFRQNFFALVGDDGTTAQAARAAGRSTRRRRRRWRRARSRRSTTPSSLEGEDPRVPRGKARALLDECNRDARSEPPRWPFYCPPTSACTSTWASYPRAVPPIRSTRHFAQGLRDRAREGHTCSTCRESAGRLQRAMQQILRAGNALSCGWSCRPIASPACGPFGVRGNCGPGRPGRGLRAAASADDRLQQAAAGASRRRRSRTVRRATAPLVPHRAEDGSVDRCDTFADW